MFENLFKKIHDQARDQLAASQDRRAQVEAELAELKAAPLSRAEVVSILSQSIDHYCAVAASRLDSRVLGVKAADKRPIARDYLSDPLFRDDAALVLVLLLRDELKKDLRQRCERLLPEAGLTQREFDQRHPALQGELDALGDQTAEIQRMLGSSKPPAPDDEGEYLIDPAGLASVKRDNHPAGYSVTAPAPTR